MKRGRLFLALVLGIVGGGCEQPATDEGGENGAEAVVVEETTVVAEPEYVKQVVKTAELMKILIDPIYEELKDAVENPPEKRDEWRLLYVAAFNLAETTNLLFSREDEEYMQSPEWIEESLKAQELTIALGDSIRNQADYEVIKENYLAVMRNCNDCHREFEPGEVDEIVGPRSWDVKVEEDPNKIVIQ